MTHACCLDGVCNLGEELLVLGGILASYEDLDREPAALDLVEVLGCETRQRLEEKSLSIRHNKPFFWVVRM